MKPPYYPALYLDILKVPIPSLPNYPSEIRLEFTSGGRDKFLAKLKEVLAARYWQHIGSAKEEIKFVAKGYKGVAEIKKSIEQQTKQMGNLISSSFADIGALRESAKKLVYYLPHNNTGWNC